jgi:hypothetical protein
VHTSPSDPPSLLARIRWTNLARLGALLGVAALIAS